MVVSMKKGPYTLSLLKAQNTFTLFQGDTRIFDAADPAVLGYQLPLT
jgi:hypothetical protein